MHAWHVFWNDVGIPIWPNIVASLIIWVFLRLQTAAIRKEHEITREHAQARHAEMLAAIANSPTTVINDPTNVVIKEESKDDHFAGEREEPLPGR